MKLRSALLVLGLLAPLGAVAPLSPAPIQAATTSSSWTLAVGSQLVFAPVLGPSRLQMTQLPDGNLRITVMSDTVLTVTPDPTGAALYRQWTLAAGSELTVSMAGGALTWDSHKQAGVTTITILSATDLNGFAAPNTSTSLIIDPDPGGGRP